jgi:hypothetical protein
MGVSRQPCRVAIARPANSTVVTAIVSQSDTAKPVCQAPQSCAAAHAAGPMMANATPSQNAASRSSRARSRSAASGTRAASATTP